jgi:hypothetical protein
MNDDKKEQKTGFDSQRRDYFNPHDHVHKEKSGFNQQKKKSGTISSLLRIACKPASTSQKDATKSNEWDCILL